MTDLDDDERAVLAKAYASPDHGPEAIAAQVDVDEEQVREVLSEHDESAIVEVAEATNWNDPEECPFCGADIPNGGPGFMDHIDDSEPCRLGFERWRETIAEDIGGEWSG